MKLKPQIILFFVAAGIDTEKDREDAAAIAAATGKRVVFRNATVAEVTGEKPEPCLGVAGQVPANYAAAFPTYALDGKANAPEGGLSLVDTDAPEMNALGLPKGCPEDRDTLKDALTQHKVDFHPNMKTATLVDLFREAVLPTLSGESATPEA